MKSKVLSIIALFCGFIIAENAGIDTIVEVENNKKEAAPVKQGWNPDLPLNQNNPVPVPVPVIPEKKMQVPLSSEKPNQFTLKTTARSTMKADKICITAYIKSSDSVTSSRDNKTRTISAAIKSIDDKITSFKTRLYFAYMKKRTFEIEKIDEPVIQMGSEVAKPGSTNANYYNERGEYVIEITATSTAPSIAYHYCATQKIKIITDPKEPEELIKTLNWCGAIYDIDKIEFNGTFSSSVKFYGMEIIQKSKTNNNSYYNNAMPTVTYLYTGVDNNGNEQRITSAYAMDSKVNVKRKVSVVDGRVVEKEEIDDTASKNANSSIRYAGPKIQYTVSKESIDKIAPELIKAAIAKGKEQAKEVAKNYGAKIEEEPLEITQKLEATISKDLSGDVIISATANLTYKAKY
ncbi:MAG TPA: hypothetical protein DCP51_01515 [Clostridiales bacterium]|nr:MAG: hypothetical protein A2044_02740 [Candidatus Firestonebacteria bacterium GWA2_43_8]HAN20353.1 hypothetical protein [Clostridiales bacterium]